MPGLLCFSDMCLAAKSSLKDLACTLTTHCQCWIHVPYLPGPAVARQVIVPCCHVIFAQVVALNWWGSMGMCGWPSKALIPQASNQILLPISLENSEVSALVRAFNQTSQISGFSPILS